MDERVPWDPERALVSLGGVMSTTNMCKLRWGAVMWGLWMGGSGCANTYDAKELEGTWDCSVSWTWDNDGEPVPCGVEQRATCKDGKLSSVGVVSLGEAQWDELIEGTCGVEGEDLVGVRSSAKTVPRNDEARRFEEEVLDGRSLSHEQPDPETTFRSRILSYTGTELVFISEEERTVTCTRP